MRETTYCDEATEVKIDTSLMLRRKRPYAEHVLTFFVPGEAKPKGRPRFAKATGHAYTPKRTASEEAVIRAYGQKQMIREGLEQPWDGPCVVVVTALIDKPKDWWEGKEPGRGDVDNYAKLVTDALNKIVFKDDRQIVELTTAKAYSDTPGVRVHVALYADVPKPKRPRKKAV